MSVSARLSGESREPASEAAFVTSIFLGGSLGASLASLGWAHAEYGQPYVHWG
jgi:hypothetical protein